MSPEILQSELHGANEPEMFMFKSTLIGQKSEWNEIRRKDKGIVRDRI